MKFNFFYENFHAAFDFLFAGAYTNKCRARWGGSGVL